MNKLTIAEIPLTQYVSNNAGGCIDVNKFLKKFNKKNKTKISLNEFFYGDFERRDFLMECMQGNQLDEPYPCGFSFKLFVVFCYWIENRIGDAALNLFSKKINRFIIGNEYQQQLEVFKKTQSQIKKPLRLRKKKFYWNKNYEYQNKKRHE